MARNARLRLAENRHQFAHRQFGLAQQPEQPKPRHLAGRLEPVEQRVEAEGFT